MPVVFRHWAISGSALFLATTVLGVTDASAVSRAVREACRQEYFDYCNMFQVGSPQLRQCMRRNQTRLSDRCVHALITSGEVTPGERARAKIARRHRSTQGGERETRRD